MTNDNMNIGIKMLEVNYVRILGTPKEIELFDLQSYKNLLLGHNS
ncbi:hypothetical protein [Clostridium beijerinckii]|nr:hypothetical protein [Clostridium beijerinckii]